MKVGASVWCVPEEINRESGCVVVTVLGSAARIVIDLGEIILDPCEGNFVCYSSAMVQRHPYDVVSIGRPFVAEVICESPLRVSRTKRIKALWRELEEKAQRKDPVVVQVTGQNKAWYFLSIEGDIELYSLKEPLSDYLKPLLQGDTGWHRYAPIEGDSMIAQVTMASSADWRIGLDIVGPLKWLQKGVLDDRILRVWGSEIHGTPSTTVAELAHDANALISLRKWDLVCAPELKSRRSAIHVIVVDDNGVFASHLVQTLQRLGYEAEHRGDVQEILSIASHANPSTVFLIDAIMQPVDGVSLITDICEHGKDASTPPKCILMSALSWDEQSSSLGRKSLSLLTKDLTGRFIFWDKGEPDVDKAIAEIDELILGYDSFVSRVECPRMRGDPTARPTQEGSSTDAFANSTSLSDIVGEAKRQVGATWGALFEMDRNAWRVRIIAGDEPLRTRATEIGAQNYLPNSPIRDLSYQPSSILVEMRVGDHIPRFRNLLRFFGGQRSIHDAVDEPYFVSLVAIRLNIRTSKKYTFFLFFKDTPKLQHKQMVKDLESAALKAELAILHQIHEYHVERDQPFYLEGLARAGLRHDARGSLSDIRFAVRNAMDAIDRNQLGRAKTNLREIDAAAKETHQWIDESLARFHFEARMEYFDVRQVVKRGADIARAVGENSGIGRTVNIRTGGFGDSPSLIFGDAYALQRLVENLLVNAVEHGQLFIRRSVDILIECQRCEDESFPTAILIHDNGPGIHGVDLEHIFEPLFSTKENGYGMGLAVVSSIARDYGIEVEVYSTVVLVGTTFIIRLPKSMRRTHQEDRI